MACMMRPLNQKQDDAWDDMYDATPNPLNHNMTWHVMHAVTLSP